MCEQTTLSAILECGNGDMGEAWMCAVRKGAETQLCGTELELELELVGGGVPILVILAWIVDDLAFNVHAICYQH